MRWPLFVVVALGCSNNPVNIEVSPPALTSALSAVSSAELVATVTAVTADVAIANLCSGFTDLVIVDRSLTAVERDRCTKNGRGATEFSFGERTTGLIVSSHNNWVYKLSVSEARRLFSPRSEGKVVRWNQLRPGLPDKPLRLVVGAIDSGPLPQLAAQLQPGAPGIRTDVQVVGSRVVNRVRTDRYAIGVADLSSLPSGVRALDCEPCTVTGGHVVVAIEAAVPAARALTEARR